MVKFPISNASPIRTCSASYEETKGCRFATLPLIFCVSLLYMYFVILVDGGNNPVQDFEKNDVQLRKRSKINGTDLLIYSQS